MTALSGSDNPASYNPAEHGTPPDNDVEEIHAMPPGDWLQSLPARTLINAMHDIVAVKDSEGVYRAANLELCSFLGKTESEILGRTDFDLLPSEQAHACRELDLKVMRSLSPQQTEEQITGPAKTVWVSTVKTPLFGNDGRCVGVIVSMRDITGAVRAREVVARKSLFQQVLVNVSGTCINCPLDEVDSVIALCLEEMGRFVDADRAYIFSFDAGRGVAVNTHEWCAKGIRPQIANLQEVPLEILADGLALLQAGLPHHVGDVSALAPGPLRDMLEAQNIKSLLTVPMMREDRCVGCVGFDSVRVARPYDEDERTLPAMFARMLVNIGLRREAEESLRREGLRAEAASRSKSEFLANMSHEIRTPLNGILGMLQLLNTTDLNSEQDEYVHMATQAAQRMTRLLSDILDISRVEAGKLSLQSSEFSVNEIRTSVLDIFNPSASGKDVQTTFELDPHLPERLVGDETRLRQILLNLVGNSLKFTELGFVRIRTSLLGSDAPGRVGVRFEVADSGCGIPEDKLHLIFEPFEQLSQACNRGAGLGLSIVRRLVELMGGRIEARSVPGVGTTMTVTLSFGLPEEAAEDTPEPPAPRVQQPCRALRVLLVEDDLHSRKTLTALLEKSGCSVRVAGTGVEALRILGEAGFDCVLMDIHLPGMDGMETTRIIRNAPEFRNHSRTPIIAVTANAMGGDRERFLAGGMDAYVPKPVDMGLLMRTIAELTGAGMPHGPC